MGPLTRYTLCDGVYLSENEVSKLIDESKPWKERKSIGFRFNPSDRALANIYGAKLLDCKNSFVLRFFKDRDVYDLEPSELSGEANEFGEGKMYFFTRIKNKHSTNRSSTGRTMFARTAGGGCWKKNGKISDITADVKYNSEKLLVRKTPLAFFKKDKKSCKEERTAWLMEEYMLKDAHCPSSDSTSEISFGFSPSDEELLRDLFQSGNEPGSNQQQPNSHGSSDPILQQHSTDLGMGCCSSQQNPAGITLIADQSPFNHSSLRENMHTLGAFDSHRNDFSTDYSSDPAAIATAFEPGPQFSCSDKNLFICESSSSSMNHHQPQLGQCDESPNSIVTVGPNPNLLYPNAFLENNPDLIKSIDRPVLFPAPMSYENGENSGEKSGVLALCVIYLKGGKQSSSLHPSKRRCPSSVSNSEILGDSSPSEWELPRDWPCRLQSGNEPGSNQQQPNSHGSSDPILQQHSIDSGMGSSSSQQNPAGITIIADQSPFNHISLHENTHTLGASDSNRNDFSSKRQEKSPFSASIESSALNYRQLSFEKPSSDVASCSINATTNAVEDSWGQSYESSTRIDYSSATATGFEQGPPVCCFGLSDDKLAPIKNYPLFSPVPSEPSFDDNQGHQYFVNELGSNQQEHPNSYVQRG